MSTNDPREPPPAFSPWVPSNAALLGGWCGVCWVPVPYLLLAAAVQAWSPPVGHREFFPLPAAAHLAAFALLPAYPLGLAGDAFGRWWARRRGDAAAPAAVRFAAATECGSFALAAFLLIAPLVD